MPDFRQFPKGSLERKAAIAAKRRALAAEARKAPGSSKKGVPRAITDTQAAASEPPPRLSEEESAKLGKAGYRELVEWVLEHLEDKRCPVGVEGKAKALWTWASANKGEFLGKYLPLFLKDEQEHSRPGKFVDLDRDMRHLDEWERNYKEEHPTAFVDPGVGPAGVHGKIRAVEHLPATPPQAEATKPAQPASKVLVGHDGTIVTQHEWPKGKVGYDPNVPAGHIMIGGELYRYLS